MHQYEKGRVTPTEVQKSWYIKLKTVIHMSIAESTHAISELHNSRIKNKKKDCHHNERQIMKFLFVSFYSGGKFK